MLGEYNEDLAIRAFLRCGNDISDFDFTEEIGEPLGILDAEISPNILTNVRLDDNSYALTFNHSTLERVQCVVCSVSGLTVQRGGVNTLFTGTNAATVTYLKATPIDGTKYLIVYKSNDGFWTRIINRSGDTCTADAAVLVMANGAGRSIGDVVPLNNNRAMVTMLTDSGSPAPMGSVVVNYSSGTPVVGTTLTHTATFAGSSNGRLYVVSLGTTCSVMRFTSNTARLLYVDGSDVVTEGGSALSFTGVLTVGTHVGAFSTGALITGASTRIAVISSADPPTLTASYDGTTTFGHNDNAVAHCYLPLRTANTVVQFATRPSPDNGTAWYQILRVSGSDIISEVPLTALLSDFSPSILQYLAPIVLDEDRYKFAWGAVVGDKLYTQALRLL